MGVFAQAFTTMIPESYRHGRVSRTATRDQTDVERRYYRRGVAEERHSGTLSLDAKSNIDRDRDGARALDRNEPIIDVRII
jgi:hypothetical protein